MREGHDYYNTPAGAHEKVWKHGLFDAKADAGIFLMVSTRDFAKNQGLKIEISQFKDEQLALKALIAGELDSFEGGGVVFAATAKGAGLKLLGCHWIVVPHGISATDKIAKVQDLKGKQIALDTAPDHVRIVLRDPYSLGLLWAEEGCVALDPRVSIVARGAGSRFLSRDLFLARRSST